MFLPFEMRQFIHSTEVCMFLLYLSIFDLVNSLKQFIAVIQIIVQNMIVRCSFNVV